MGKEWVVVEEQIEKSTIRRYAWKEILGETLTKRIIKSKILGLTKEKIFDEILETPTMKIIERDNPIEFSRMKDKVWISICARFGENNSALRTFKEVKK